MTKNEESFLEECIQSALPFCDELIVVDTGSTDATIDIAARYTDKIFHTRIDDDFSGPRNVALDHVRTPWVLYLDADERLSQATGPALTAVLGAAGAHVEALSTLRYNFISSGSFYADNVVRIFRNREHIRYRNRVAESVVPAVTEAGSEITRSATVINHIGNWRSPAVRRMKSDWYVELLTARLAEDPGSSELRWRLALTLKKVGRMAEADELSYEALELSPDSADAQSARAHVLRMLDQPGEALELYRRVVASSPDNAQAWNMVGIAELSIGNLPSARKALEHARLLDERLTHTLINQGLVAQAAGEYHAAVELYESAARENPAFLDEHWLGVLEADPFQHLANDSVMRFAGLAYHLAYCRWKLDRAADPARLGVGE
ncbi:glycosyltransferase [Nocardia sp. NPDC060249]|uniref:glycosyltransferase n=1 Tax=Nocardia sp. NPDC060249 TaxID=3347082 RepID=UPI003654963A